MQIKSVVLTLVLALTAGSGAFAATGGQLPVVSDGIFGEESVNSDAYSNHGEDVSRVARDKDAVGTWTNPNGKVIENHGQAVREAAHNKENGADNVIPPDHSSAGGNAPDHSNAGGNAPDQGNGGGSAAGHVTPGGNGGNGNSR